MNLTPFYIIAFFVFGTIIGSFLSMLIYRIKHDTKGIIFGRSFCTHCKVQLKSYDMIPLLSYMFLKGKCRACNKKISMNYFLIELTTGIIFATTFLQHNFLTNISPVITAFWLLIYAIGIAIVFYDINYMEIPLRLTVPLTIIGALGAYFLIGMSLQFILIGALIGKLFFYLQYKISKGKWVGLGDSDLAMALGAILGPIGLYENLTISYALGAIFGIILMINKKATMQTKLPFGPFILFGFYVTTVYGERILDWYFKFGA